MEVPELGTRHERTVSMAAAGGGNLQKVVVGQVQQAQAAQLADGWAHRGNAAGAQVEAGQACHGTDRAMHLRGQAHDALVCTSGMASTAKGQELLPG
jgi:hypothetical protein